MCKLFVYTVFLSLVVLVLCAPAPEEDNKKVSSTTTTVPPTRKKHLETFVEVTYGDEKIVLGNFVNASQLKHEPTVAWKTEENTLYTLALINLDAPTKKNPVDSDYLHWLVGNIPGNDLSKGDVLAEYVGAFPEKDQGTQNMMFILNEQPQGRVNFTEAFISKTNGTARKNFKINDLSIKYNFGIALSFNTLKAEYDEYSDLLRKQLYPEEKAVEMNEEMIMEAVETKEMEMKCTMVPKVKMTEDAVKEKVESKSKSE